MNNKVNKKILEKAILKAIDNGYGQAYVFLNMVKGNNWIDIYPEVVMGWLVKHEFAKALWGDLLVATRDIEADELIKLTTQDDHTTDDVAPAWHHHLQMMVIADDPIKYLGENI